MRFHRIYIPASLRRGEQIDLPSATAHRLIQVLRLTSGEKLLVFNGEGGEYLATLQLISRNQARITIEEYIPCNRESSLKTELGMVLIGGQRMDYAVQKATELGVSSLTPLLSQRCEIHLDSRRQKKRTAHLQAVAQHACEQCGRTAVPHIGEPLSLQDWLEQTDCADKILLTPDGIPVAQVTLNPLHSLAILCGPEGGFCDDEVQRITAAGFTRVSLGKRILRAETAPVVALAVIQHQQ